jgi:hypothetical protein
MSTKIYVMRVGFLNWLCDAVCSGEDPVLTYFKDDITGTVIRALKVTYWCAYNLRLIHEVSLYTCNIKVKIGCAVCATRITGFALFSNKIK